MVNDRYLMSVMAEPKPLQLAADRQGFLSAEFHSPVPGKVRTLLDQHLIVVVLPMGGDHHFLTMLRRKHPIGNGSQRLAILLDGEGHVGAPHQAG